MAETSVTPLLSALHLALDRVSREPIGLVRTVSKSAGVVRAAKDQPVTVPIVPELPATDNTPASSPPNTAGQGLQSVNVTITKSKGVDIPWSGENTRALDNAGPDMYDQVTGGYMAQAFRTLLNLVEVDVFAAAYIKASRAYGTAGTTPFNSTTKLADGAKVAQILDENGAPTEERALVVDPSAMANLRSLDNLTKVNEAGSSDTLRMGSIGALMGFAEVAQSAKITAHTKGTGAGYLVDLVAGYDVGDTEIHVDTGTGAILAGDVAVFQDDANKYVVGTGFAGDGDGDIAINTPGLRAALADNKTLTLGPSYTPNLAFHRGAIALAIRPPALPKRPDGSYGDAAQHELVVDPISGIAFDVAFYGGFHQNLIRVSIAWGVSVVKPAHIATLLG